MTSNPSGYIPLRVRGVTDGSGAVWEERFWPFEASSPGDLEAWDHFLEGAASAQYFQTTAWARMKQHEHWRPFLWSVRRAGETLGNALVLVKRTRLGRIAYLSKGPVLTSNPPEDLAGILVQGLQTVCRRRGVRVLCFQAPDEDCGQTAAALRHGCIPDALNRVVAADVVVSLEGHREGVLHRMGPSMRKKLRQAGKRGLRVRSGTAADLAVFYRLMAETCRRQGETRVNPASPRSLEILWEGLRSGGGGRRSAELLLAELDGRIVAGLMCLGLRSRLTMFKKGWDGTEGERRPNELLAWSAIEWAIDHGFTEADFGGLDRRIAERVLRGEGLEESELQRRDLFKLGFGGRVALLPGAMLYSPWPPIRWLLRGACAWKSRGRPNPTPSEASTAAGGRQVSSPAGSS